MTIEWEEFSDWANDKKIIYTTGKTDITKRHVKFIVNLMGGYIVTVDGKEIYNGGYFAVAADAYNDALSRQPAAGLSNNR